MSMQSPNRLTSAEYIRFCNHLHTLRKHLGSWTRVSKLFGNERGFAGSALKARHMVTPAHLRQAEALVAQLIPTPAGASASVPPSPPEDEMTEQPQEPTTPEPAVSVPRIPTSRKNDVYRDLVDFLRDGEGRGWHYVADLFGYSNHANAVRAYKYQKPRMPRFETAVQTRPELLPLIHASLNGTIPQAEPTTVATTAVRGDYAWVGEVQGGLLKLAERVETERGKVPPLLRSPYDAIIEQLMDLAGSLSTSEDK